jgi:hypothetical protein
MNVPSNGHHPVASAVDRSLKGHYKLVTEQIIKLPKTHEPLDKIKYLV